jgi:hypothetical protein
VQESGAQHFQHRDRACGDDLRHSGACWQQHGCRHGHLSIAVFGFDDRASIEADEDSESIVSGNPDGVEKSVATDHKMFAPYEFFEWVG